MDYQSLKPRPLLTTTRTQFGSMCRLTSITASHGIWSQERNQRRHRGWRVSALMNCCPVKTAGSAVETSAPPAHQAVDWQPAAWRGRTHRMLPPMKPWKMQWLVVTRIGRAMNSSPMSRSPADPAEQLAARQPENACDPARMLDCEIGRASCRERV